MIINYDVSDVLESLASVEEDVAGLQDDVSGLQESVGDIETELSDAVEQELTTGKNSNVGGTAIFYLFSHGFIKEVRLGIFTYAVEAASWNDVVQLPTSIVKNRNSTHYGYVMDEATEVDDDNRFRAAEIRVTTNGMLQIYNPHPGHNYWGSITWIDV